jgi:hypothetical protein
MFPPYRDIAQNSFLYFLYIMCTVMFPPYRDIAQNSFLYLLYIMCTVMFPLYRDIAKNSLLRWPIFIYWTFLGVFDAVVFFFGSYFLFNNSTFTSNGQVKTPSPWLLEYCVTEYMLVCCIYNDRLIMLHFSKPMSSVYVPAVKECPVIVMWSGWL